MSRDYCTIGHSTRPLEEFVEIPRLGAADLVVDVRSIPRSRTNPLYNRDALPGNLAVSDRLRTCRRAGRAAEQVAGRSGRCERLLAEPQLSQLRGLCPADAFEAGLCRLTELGETRCCAIMWSEAVWWRCHRRIIADYLLHRGETVLYLKGPAQVEPASITPAAVGADDGKLVYPSSPKG
jgi:uncharacterized protein (DUF488 family)